MPTLDETLAALELLDERRTTERWRYFKPVGPQKEFLDAGAKHPERMLMAGNGNGKTETAAFEVACHLTGNYPVWWTGYRFKKPIVVWSGSLSGAQSRDGAQKKLFYHQDSPTELGTGFIPKDAIVGNPVTSRNAPGSIDNATIKHASGRNSRIVFKTYEQGREMWQGADVDLLWMDEEPPNDVLSEGLARLRGRGLFLMTFTPLNGLTDVVRRFLENMSKLRHLTRMKLADCSWITPEEKARTIEQYPAHERDARLNGTPMLGEGRVFSTPIEDLLETSLQLEHVPEAWPRLWGIDFGIGHPFAAVLVAWDRDNDIVHLLRSYRVKGAIPLQHADAMKRIAANVPIAWPHDGAAREASSGEPLAASYRKLELNMLKEHATFSTGGYSFEAGIMELENRMTSGRFKVNRLLTDWIDEYGSYHRKDGLVVKVQDDLMSATRIAVMMLRKARCVPFGSKLAQPKRTQRRSSINPWTGRSEEPVRDPRGAMYGDPRNNYPGRPQSRQRPY